MSEARTCENQVLEIIEHGFGGDVAILAYLVGHHFTLAGELARRENGVAKKVREKIGCAEKVAVGIHGIDNRGFFGGVGIKFAATSLHAVYNVPRAATLSAFEEHMLNKMSQAVKTIRIIAASGINGCSEVIDLGVVAAVYQSES